MKRKYWFQAGKRKFVTKKEAVEYAAQVHRRKGVFIAVEELG